MSEGCGKKGLVFSGSPRHHLPGQRIAGYILVLTSGAEHSRGLAGFSKSWGKEHSLQQMLERRINH